MRNDEPAGNESRYHPTALEHHGRRRVSANWHQAPNSQQAKQQGGVPDFSRPLSITSLSHSPAAYQPQGQTSRTRRSSSLQDRRHRSEGDNDQYSERTWWQQDTHEAPTNQPVVETGGGLWATDRHDFATNVSSVRPQRDSQLLGSDGIAPDEIARRHRSGSSWASSFTAVANDEQPRSRKRWSWKRISGSSQEQRRRWPSFHRRESTRRARSFDLTQAARRRLSTISLPTTLSRVCLWSYVVAHCLEALHGGVAAKDGFGESTAPLK